MVHSVVFLCMDGLDAWTVCASIRDLSTIGERRLFESWRLIEVLRFLRQTAQPYKRTVYNIQQQCATQGSIDTAYTLSRMTAATTGYNTDRGGRLPETDGRAPSCCQQSDQVGPAVTSQAFTRWRHQSEIAHI